MIFLAINWGYMILGGIRLLTAVICNFIYSLTAWMYQLFMTIARINILSTDQVAPIYERITMILTIVMTFYITFELVKYAINPDTISDKEKGAGNVVTKLLIVVVLIAFVPRIFELAYDLQRSILENQVISKVILGTEDTDMGTLGNEFSANMLGLFYNIDKEECDKASSNNCGKASVIIDENLTNLRETGSIDITDHLNITVEKGSITNDTDYHFAIKFDFAGLLPLIVGGVILYVLGLFSIDLGTRYVQLLFLQLIAPITIMGYLTPKKDGIFQKWVKQCITTYLDVFIRLAIIYFVLLIIKVLGDAFVGENAISMFDGVTEVTTSLKVFTYIILVIGLLIFAQKAPKLISELFPSSGAAGIGFGLSPKERVEAATKSAKGLYSAAKMPFGAVGMGRRIAAGAGGYMAGLLGTGSFKHAAAAAKEAFDKKHKGLFGGSVINRMRHAAHTVGAVRQQRADVENEGGTVWGYEHSAQHYKNMAQEQDRHIANLEAAAKGKDTVASSVGEIKALKQLNDMKQAAINSGNDKLALRLANDIKNVEKMVRIYSADRSTTNLDALHQAIREASAGTAMGVQLGVVADANGNYVTHVNNSAAQSKMSDIVEATSDKYNIIQTSQTEAKKAAVAAMGNEEINGVAISNMTDAQFAEKIGDVQTRANELVGREKASDAYKRAHANAKGPTGGGSGK